MELLNKIKKAINPQTPDDKQHKETLKKIAKNAYREGQIEGTKKKEYQRGYDNATKEGIFKTILTGLNKIETKQKKQPINYGIDFNQLERSEWLDGWPGYNQTKQNQQTKKLKQNKKETPFYF